MREVRSDLTPVTTSMALVGTVVTSHLRASPDDPECLAVIAEAADQRGISPLALRLDALLHLPRVASAEGFVDRQAASDEVRVRADDLSVRWQAVPDLVRPPKWVPASPTELTLRNDDSLAREILTHLHYLTSFRPSSEHLVCTTGDGKPVALASVSPLDVHTVEERLPAGLAPNRVRVLSRVFAFDWAPANTLTWLFGQVARRLRDQVDLLLTYVNPNVGFNAASYRAGNWSVVASEQGTRYAYLDRNYVTDRELFRSFGTSDPVVLGPGLPERIAYSRMSLRPLEIYGVGLTKAGRALLPAVPWIVPRPTP
jgi:hypothetical protein